MIQLFAKVMSTVPTKIVQCTLNGRSVKLFVSKRTFFQLIISVILVPQHQQQNSVQYFLLSYGLLNLNLMLKRCEILSTTHGELTSHLIGYYFNIMSFQAIKLKSQLSSIFGCSMGMEKTGFQSSTQNHQSPCHFCQCAFLPRFRKENRTCTITLLFHFIS